MQLFCAVPSAQIARLSDELEKTKSAAKGELRRMSVELQGLRDEYNSLKNVRLYALCARMWFSFLSSHDFLISYFCA
jgi:hypothetical protein